MLEYINDLTEEEFVQFEKFVASIYFNSNKNLIRLFSYLKTKYPDISEKDIRKKELSLMVYNEKKVNDIKIRKLLSDFCILFEKFLAQIEIERNKLTNDISLLQSLRRHGFLKRFEMNSRQIRSKQRNTFSKDFDYYQNQINFETEIYYYHFSKFKLEFADCLQRKSNSIDYLFIYSKLHTFYEMLQNTVSKNFSFPSFKKSFYEEIVSFIKANKKTINEHHPNIYIIYLALMLWTSSDESHLKKILNYLDKHETKFLKKNLSYYYNYIVSYYMQKINEGKTEYRADVFRIFTILRDKKLFLIDNMITDTEFNNVIYVALSLEKFTWVDEFIEEYKSHLDPGFAKDAYNMAKAKLAFQKRDFKNIFPYLKEVEFKDPTYYFNSKILLARVYYEMENFDGVRYLTNNLRQYIYDKKILTVEQVKSIKIFVRYIIRLVNLLERPARKRKNFRVIFKKELDNEKSFVSNKNWFYEKLSEL